MMAATAGGAAAAWRRTSARLSAERNSSPVSRSAISTAVIPSTMPIAPIHAKRRPPPAQRLFEMHVRRRIFPCVEAKESKLSFETALGKLESIVEAMESGDVPQIGRA